MRRATAFFFAVFILVFGFAFSADVSAYHTALVYLDGRQLYFDVSPYVINNTTLVPVRTVLEAIGAVVSWDSGSRMTVASKNGTIVWIGENIPAMTVQKNGYTYQSSFGMNPYVINGRILVPVRPLVEAFGVSVSWNPYSHSVTLSSAVNAALNTVPYYSGAAQESIQISGFNPPATTNLGSSYSISGTISANAMLDRLNVKVTDSSTGRVQINETQFDINAASYSLANIDDRVRFGILSAGNKLLEITVVTKNETRQTFSYYFDVVRPAGATVSNGASMLWPVPSSGLLTTIFWCDNPYCHSNAGRVSGHAAIDIAANENAAVIAVKDGTVLKAGFGDSENGFSGYGNFILVDHGNGLTTQYSHLYSIYVSPGDYVSAGQTIGGVGNTGNSTGNHLDFNIEINGQRCDPLYYLDMHPNVQCYEPCDKPYFEQALSSRGLR